MSSWIIVVFVGGGRAGEQPPRSSCHVSGAAAWQEANFRVGGGAPTPRSALGEATP